MLRALAAPPPHQNRALTPLPDDLFVIVGGSEVYRTVPGWVPDTTVCLHGVKTISDLNRFYV